LKLGIPIAAGALLASASAASCFAQAVPVGATAFGSAAAPSFVTETIVWNGARALPLETSPLALLGRPAAAFTSEWAPLYRGADGTRLEQAHQDVRVAARFGAWWAGADLASESSAFRSGQTRGASQWGFDAGAAPAQRGAVAAGIVQTRGAAAIATSLAADGRVGLAVEGRAMLAPAWSALVRASATPRDGALDVRWQDEAIESSGRWDEQRALARIEASAAATSIAATLEAFDRVPVRARARADGFEPHLTCRGATLAMSRAIGAVEVGAELRHGEGRQRIDVSRAGVPYAVAAGPVREDVAIVSAGPRTGRWSARAWTGRSHDVASGSLALWPFDGIAAVAGTRYAAHTDLELRHAGVSIDGRVTEHPGLGRRARALDRRSARPLRELARHAVRARPRRLRQRRIRRRARVARRPAVGALAAAGVAAAASGVGAVGAGARRAGARGWGAGRSWRRRPRQRRAPSARAYVGRHRGARRRRAPERLRLEAFRRHVVTAVHGSTRRITKLFGTIGGRGCGCSSVGAGGSPKLALASQMRCDAGSSAIVRAPRCVSTFATTRNESGASSCTTVSVPSPFELNASIFVASNSAPSGRSPIGTVATTLPASPSDTTIVLLLHALNSRW
jgi:hypothetical protein